MENPSVAALVSLLVSQAVLLFSLPPTAAVFGGGRGGSATNLTSLLLLHFLSSHELAFAFPFLPRRRKRPRAAESPDPDAPLLAAAPAVAAAPIRVRRQPDHFPLGLGVSAPTFEWLSGLLEPLLDCPADAAGGGAAVRLALGLAHHATGVSYAELAARFGVPAAAAQTAARRLRRVLCTNFRFYLAFPSSPGELTAVSAAFSSLPGGGGLPGCCGAVAGAHFAVGGGLTAQVVADASGRILNIAAGFRGGYRDSTVLKMSSLYRDLEAGRLLRSLEQYLVGGKHYPLLPWLMVPFKDATVNSPEEGFNAAHGQMLRPVRRTIASLRNWGVLSSPVEGNEDGREAAACVATCAILHNVLLMREDYSMVAEEEEEEECVVGGGKGQEEGVTVEGAVEQKAIALREALAAKTREAHYGRSASEQS